MNLRSAKEVMLCWNAGTDEVAIVPWPGRGAAKHLQSSTLACLSIVHEMSPLELRAFVFIEAMHLIVRDGCDPQAVHRALLGVREYVDGCSDDMPGVAEIRRREGIE